MPATPLPVDPLLSFARRDGDAVRVVLTLPSASFAARQVWVRFQGEAGGVRARAEVTEHAGGLRVESSVPRSELPDGVWRLKLRTGPKQPLRNLRTKLLVSDARPVALLPRFGAADVGT